MTMQPDAIPSPVTGGATRLVDEFDVAAIVERYRLDWGLDVLAHFRGLTSIPLYRCEDTGYRFFHPPWLAGEAAFYDQLWQAEMREGTAGGWRDDMQFGLDRLRAGERVLDVGCAEGSFVKRAAAIADAQGIDGNEIGCRKAQAEGLNVSHATVSDFARSHPEAFDTVVSFQVLEHVYDVKTFVSGLKDLVRPGGRIIISVPNNEPYYAGWAKYEPLNNPPHHIGLWNQASLRALASHFGLAVDEVAMTGEAAGLKAHAFRRAAFLAGVSRNPSQLSKSDWAKLALAAPAGILWAAASILRKRSDRYAYMAIVLKKPEPATSPAS